MTREIAGQYAVTLPVSLFTSSEDRAPPMTVGAPYIALCDFVDEPLKAAVPAHHGHIAHLVAAMIELKRNQVREPAIEALRLEQKIADVREVSPVRRCHHRVGVDRSRVKAPAGMKALEGAAPMAVDADDVASLDLALNQLRAASPSS